MPDIVDRKALLIAANSIGADILPDNALWTNRLQIRSETSSRLYIVAQSISSGTFGCSCMGWKRHRNCKHLKVIAPALVAAGVSSRGVR